MYEPMGAALGGRTLPSLPTVHPLGKPLMEVYVVLGRLLTDVTAEAVVGTHGYPVRVAYMELA